MLSILQNMDPFTQPSFTLKNRLARLLWNIVFGLFFQFSPRPLHSWRSFLLRCFGAKIGNGCHIYPNVKIWAPWNLVCEDVVAIADEAIIYNPSPIFLGSHSIISQQAYLCGASHDYNSPTFSIISSPIYIGAYSWVCARATVQMGVSLEEGSILGLGSIATKSLESWTIYAGIPAKKIKQRIKII
jgi:putative colanic acid biosynthesis acetyltransferase WcaF